jgi:pimeloyl-ACP methyl ester carboxylesterase
VDTIAHTSSPVTSQQVTSADGTLIEAWSSQDSGIPVLMCNGLGASPSAWPAIVAEASGFRVVGWDYRGLGASERPRNPERVQVEDHTADARAVLDAFGLPSATVVGWSLGVNVAFELALQDPGRVSGVLAVAGVPGGSFSSLFGPLGVPRRLRAPAGRLSSRLLPVVGRLMPLLMGGMQPWQTLLEPAVAHRSAGDVRRLETLAEVLREFAGHDWGWFRHLAVAAADHAPLDLSPLSCPVTLLAGRYDTLVDVADMRTAAEGLPGTRYRQFPGTHFLPLQYPELMLDELALLAEARSAAW